LHLYTLLLHSKRDRIKKDEVNSDDEDDVEILDDNEVNIEKIEEELDEIYSSDEEDNDGGWVQQSATQQDETQWVNIINVA
jgi:hypothetical protein